MKQIVVLCIFSLFAKGKIPKFFYLKCVDQAEKKISSSCVSVQKFLIIYTF